MSNAKPNTSRRRKALPHPRDARFRVCLTQREVAEKAGIDIGTVSRAERSGEYPRRLTTRRKLMVALGLQPEAPR